MKKASTGSANTATFYKVGLDELLDRRPKQDLITEEPLEWLAQANFFSAIVRNEQLLAGAS